MQEAALSQGSLAPRMEVDGVGREGGVSISWADALWCWLA